MVGTPRAINGFGPYDDDGLYAYFGFGAQVTVSRFFRSLVRLDGTASLAQVFGDGYVEGDHGPEGALGAAILIVSPWRCSFGGGFGVDMVVAREIDAATPGAHFGWLGFRMSFPAEVAWPSRTHGRGFAMSFAPTLTRVGYQTGLWPGFVMTAGFELPVGRATRR
jgi:hypothetical protein